MAEKADLIIYVADASRELDENDGQILDMIRNKKTVILLNKSDLDPVITVEMIKEKAGDIPIISASAKEEQGIQELEETEKRIIRVTVKRVAAMISVHMENYMADGETIEFADGLPLSSKGEKDYHGFGMRSMRMSVEKYGGVLCVDVKGDIFSVDIMLPVPAAQRNAPSAAAGTEGKGV